MATEIRRIDLAATLANSQEAAIVPAVGLELAVELRAIDQAAVQRIIARGAGLVLAIVLAAELVLAIDRVVVRAQVIVRVAGKLEHAPAAELALVQAVAVLEPDQVAVVLVRDHLRDRLAVPLRTKSVTTAHRPDLVPLLAGEEDLAAVVAETTREPVAAEAVIAWAAAE